MIYFVRRLDTGEIKVGYTDQLLRNRFRQIKCEHQCEIEVLGIMDGGIDEENVIRERFKAQRFDRDWMNPDAEVMSFIKANTRPHDPKEKAKGRNRLYQIWIAMKQRCYDRNFIHYGYYGGRGIGVCPEWKHDFSDFHEWAGSNGYEDHLELDRKENDLDYSPSNCKWSGRQDQARNRRSAVMLTAFGLTLNAKDWARDPRCIVEYRLLLARIKKGWDHEKAITTPPFDCRKLRPEDIPVIQTRIAAGHRVTDIGRDFGVTTASIIRIRRGERPGTRRQGSAPNRLITPQ